MKDTRELVCPYCGSSVTMRKGSELVGSNAKVGKVYVCSNYPVCDAYVSADAKGRPMGTLANKRLRSLRIQAHSAFDRLWQSGCMTCEWAYKWLSVRLHISLEQCHIGKFSVKRCQETIKICEEAWVKREEARDVC